MTSGPAAASDEADGEPSEPDSSGSDDKMLHQRLSQPRIDKNFDDKEGRKSIS